MPHRTLLVTVGSTLFPALTDSVLSPSFISLLSSHGIDRLIIQYGRADLPFNTTTKDMAMNPAGHGSTVWKPDGSSSGVAVEVMRFTDDFEGLVASADAIISHAGSGSILTVLRSKPVKRLLIVPNTSLMDNHQVELAEALEARNHLLVSTVEDLETRLPSLLSDSTKLEPFPDVQPGRFAGILDATMGYAS